MRTHELLQANNPYLYNLSKSLQKNFEVVNYGQNIKGGILDIAKYFGKSDIFYFNWLENISKPKALVFAAFTKLAKALGKKIVWTHHNVHSHYTRGQKSQFLIEFLIKNVDHIVIHTKESYNILGCSKSDPRVHYFFHPFFSGVSEISSGNVSPKYDLLIWGNVRRSKGVDQFLDYLKKTNKLNRYRILIIGKFESDEYFSEIQASFQSNSIIIRNEFVSSSDLDQLHQQARYVFFPYTGSSVLNSGALITSIPKLVPIIGPNKGAFKELGELKLIETYENFENVTDLIESGNGSQAKNVEHVKQFCEQHSWELFADFLQKKIK
jgi:hypothetical protein